MTSQISSTNVACTAGEESPLGAAAVTETVQRPSASTENRRLSAAPLGTRAEAGDRRAGERLGERAEGGAGAGRDAVLGHGGVLALERDRDAGLAGDRGAQDRLGVEQADDPAGRGGAAAVAASGHAAAAVDGRDDLEHLVAVAGGDHEGAELAGVARVAEQVRELAEVEAGHRQLAERLGHAGARDAELGQAVVGRWPGG